eukprot:6206354-Pleurochrysis_carterae.AAC.1
MRISQCKNGCICTQRVHASKRASSVDARGQLRLCMRENTSLHATSLGRYNSKGFVDAQTDFVSAKRHT